MKRKIKDVLDLADMLLGNQGGYSICFNMDPNVAYLTNVNGDVVYSSFEFSTDPASIEDALDFLHHMLVKKAEMRVRELDREFDKLSSERSRLYILMSSL